MFSEVSFAHSFLAESLSPEPCGYVENPGSFGFNSVTFGITWNFVILIFFPLQRSTSSSSRSARLRVTSARRRTVSVANRHKHFFFSCMLRCAIMVRDPRVEYSGLENKLGGMGITRQRFSVDLAHCLVPILPILSPGLWRVTKKWKKRGWRRLSLFSCLFVLYI